MGEKRKKTDFIMPAIQRSKTWGDENYILILFITCDQVGSTTTVKSPKSLVTHELLKRVYESHTAG